MSQAFQHKADLSPKEKRTLLAQLLRKKVGASKSFYPLSDNQQGIWFLCQFAPESSVYNVSFAARIRSQIDIPAFRRAFQALVDRHPSLRTTITVRSGKPVQQIHEQQPVHFEEADASTWREDKLQTWLLEETQRPFDLERGPVMRVSLLTRSEQEHILLLVIHHIVVDFWSLAVILNELGVLYSAEKAGRSAALPRLDLQYTDFVLWQAEMLASPAGERLWDYWKKQLAGPLPVLALPTDRPRPPIQMFRGAQHAFVLNDALAGRLKALAKAEGATLYMVLVAAFELMLYYHSGQEDILVASPMAGRSRAEFEGMVGFFANPVVLRANLSGNPTFRAFLGQVRQTVLAALEHQDYPTLRLMQQLRPPRDLSRPPLCQAMFVLDKPHRVTEQAVPAFARGETGLWMDLGGIVMETIPLDRRAATLDLVLLIIEASGSLSASIRFNTDLFDEASIARMAGHFQALLESVIRDPAATIGDLEILTAAERQQLLVEFNDTKTEYPKDKCIHQLFEEQVQRTPDNVAVVFEEQQLTYAQLNARANQLAHHLQTLGVGPEVPVALCMERCTEMVVGLLGILKAGGAYVPLDPAYPRERLSFIMKDAHAAVLLTRGDMMGIAPEQGIHAVNLDSGWEDIAGRSEENPVAGATAKNLAYILYTSGSTGQPKGVMVEHGGLCNTVNWLTHTLELSAADRCLLKTPITFDAVGRELFPTLLTGGTLVIAESGGHRDSRYLAKMMRSERITIFHCVPSLLQFLVEEPPFDDSLALRAVMCGGEALPAQVVERFQRRSKAKLYNVYGPTETIIDSTYWLCAEANGQSSSPIGRPIPNARIYILNDALRPLPIGVAGHMHIGGVSLARGYLNRPDLTAEKFIPDPFSAEPGARMYKTGDLARYRPDGNIEFLGRADHQVKIRGFRIELGEIEAALGQHPAVREAMVLAREDAPGEKRLVAYVVAESTAEELRHFLKDKLPEYMVPGVVVLLDTMPLLSNGKVDRRALPAPDRSRPELDKSFVAPRDDLELQLAHIWEEILGIRPVGVRDNFFELGGHSLLAIRLFALIEKRLGKKLPVTAVFQGATVEHLADVLRHQATAGPQSSLVAIQPGGSRPPLFLVHPAGGHVFPYVHLAQLLGPDQPCYGLQAKGLEDGQEPHTRIEDMAAHYLQALQTVQPAGPYLLGGWSMGGEVAFEMAQQLHAQGQQVALLALLDSRVPTLDEAFPEEDADAILLVERYFGISFGPMEFLAKRSKDEQLAFILEHAKSAGLVPAEFDLSQARRFVQLIRSDLRATHNYELHRYPGRVTLFKASETLTGTSPDPTFGWSEWAGGGVEVHIVPGNHANMIYKPHVEVLAEKLTTCLNQAQSAEAAEICATATIDQKIIQ